MKIIQKVTPPRNLLLYSQLILPFLWVNSLLESSSYLITYVFIAFVGGFCAYKNHTASQRITGWRHIVVVAFSCLFTLATLWANYDLFEGLHFVLYTLKLVILLFGSFSISYHIAFYFCMHFPIAQKLGSRTTKGAVLVFLCSFFLIAAIDMFYLFAAEYPGLLTYDPIVQIEQIVTGTYSNHHPYWHTMILQFWINIGLKLFGNYNDAVALYSVWQLCFMAACFSYAVMTLYQAGFSKALIFAAFSLYAFAPYNIAYSVAIWKDIMFAGTVLLFIASLYRIFKKIGKCLLLNYIVFIVAGIGMGVLRSNGWLALLAAFVLSFFFLKAEHKKTLLIWFAALAISWGMKGPYLAAIGVTQPDILESLSIPLQQVARVIEEGHTLSARDEGLIDTVVDLYEVPSLYKPYISDPIKNEIRSKGMEYFEEHILEYFKLWVRLGLQHPKEYFHAWIDQTKGYWNGGYEYWVMLRGVFQNNYGIDNLESRSHFGDEFSQIMYDAQYTPELNLLYSIGFHVWLVLLLFVCNTVNKRKEALLTLPILMIIATLLVATPVFSEFRYAYSVFTTYPFLTVVSLFSAQASISE